MDVQLKYIGQTNSNFTTGKQYSVLGFVGSCGAMLINDKSALVAEGSVTDQARWQLVFAGTPASTVTKPK